MLAMWLGLRPQSLAARPARAHWTASAVPQEPAPSTAMSACTRGVADTGLKAPALLVLGRVGAFVLRAGGVQGVEVDRWQQQLRKAALAHQLRHDGTRVRKQHVRA